MHRGGNKVFALYAQKNPPVGGYASLTGMMRKTYSAERQQKKKKRNTKEQHLIMQISKGGIEGCEERGEQMVDRKPAFISFSVSLCVCLAAAAL